MVERPRRRPQACCDRRDRYGGRPLCGSDGLRCAEKVHLAEFGMAHTSRVIVLEYGVNKFQRTRLSQSLTSKRLRQGQPEGKRFEWVEVPVGDACSRLARQA